MYFGRHVSDSVLRDFVMAEAQRNEGFKHRFYALMSARYSEVDYVPQLDGLIQEYCENIIGKEYYVNFEDNTVSYKVEGFIKQQMVPALTSFEKLLELGEYLAGIDLYSDDMVDYYITFVLGCELRKILGGCDEKQKQACIRAYQQSYAKVVSSDSFGDVARALGEIAENGYEGLALDYEEKWE